MTPRILARLFGFSVGYLVLALLDRVVAEVERREVESYRVAVAGQRLLDALDEQERSRCSSSPA